MGKEREAEQDRRELLKKSYCISFFLSFGRIERTPLVRILTGVLCRELWVIQLNLILERSQKDLWKDKKAPKDIAQVLLSGEASLGIIPTNLESR